MIEDKHSGERIAKRIARAGICSRRDAEKLICDGKVKVNGQEIDSPALNVKDSDKIVVNGELLPEIQETRLFLYHKPAGLVTSHKDERDRETVFDSLPKEMPRVISIGRLDLNTEGLLLLTNDGELARFLELPDTGWARKYRARVHGKVNENRLKSLQNGITIEGVRYKSIEAVLEDKPEDRLSPSANSWISLTLREGKNREIRKVMEALGLNVTRLIRTDYGPFSLGKMSKGEVVEVKNDVMRHQVSKYFVGKVRIEAKKPVIAEKEEKKVDPKKARTPRKNSRFDKFDKPEKSGGYNKNNKGKKK